MISGSFKKTAAPPVGASTKERNVSKDSSNEEANILEGMDEISSADIRKAQKYWSFTADRSVFWGTSNISDSIPPGLYKCANRDDVGPCFQKIIIATDTLIDLPDTSCDQVVNEIEQFWGMKAKFEERGFLHKRGILMFGEPGSGKTSAIQQLIKKIISRKGMAIYADDPHILTSCLQLLRRIEAERPAIVVLEDFETLTDRERRENEWLSVLDGEAQIDNVVFLATTNYIQRLDKRFTDRPSRFDLIVPVYMPSARARAIFLKTKESSLTLKELQHWVKTSDGFSIAHLKEMIVGAKCYGKPINEVVDRLRQMHKREFTNDDLERRAKGKSGLGFTADKEEPVDEPLIDINELKKIVEKIEKERKASV